MLFSGFLPMMLVILIYGGVREIRDFFARRAAGREGAADNGP